MTGLIILLVAAIAGLVYLGKIHLELREKFKKYEPLAEVDSEVERLKDKRSKFLTSIEALEKLHEKLRKECDIFEEAVEISTFGFYTPRYGYADSSRFKTELDEVRSLQKNLIKEKEAIVCGKTWQVDGSVAKGRQMVDRIVKLGLSAFNVQCDNMILKVRHDNIQKYEERMHKIRENVDKLLSANHCEITEPFFQLKLKELHLAHEYAEKINEEKEEQRQIREQMREEERVHKEIENARREAEKEEVRFEQALKKAKEELEGAQSEEKSKMQEQILELERRLKESHEAKERAISMAQQTKRGHVYVVSNIGSFGERVFKIGMTRRLEPLERVKELGDASVPFDFDIHAMIFSENAPELEKTLHDHFDKFRVNRINNRKEFFSVDLKDIEEKCRELNAEVSFTKIAEAKEYRETMALIAEENQVAEKSVEELEFEVVRFDPELDSEEKSSEPSEKGKSVA